MLVSYRVLALLLTVLTGFVCLFFTAQLSSTDLPEEPTAVHAPKSKPSAKDIEKAAFREQAKLSRGFVTCVAHKGRETGRPPDAALAAAALRRLRALGNTDPFLAFHVDNELDAQEQKLLLSAGVRIADLRDQMDDKDLAAVKGDSHRYRSFDCLIMALLHSPFDDTMLVDSDILFFVNPSYLWSTSLLRESGTLFFHDRNVRFGEVNQEVCQEIRDFSQKLHLNTNDGMEAAHPEFCSGNSAGEQCSTLIVVKQRHPVAAKFLEMLKKLHTSYIMLDPQVQAWSYGDKEFYWIACELAGIRCDFTPKGRPMHAFYTDDANGLSQSERTGCNVQLRPEPGETGLLYGNLDDGCPWFEHGLSHITVWNPANLHPAIIVGDRIQVQEVMSGEMAKGSHPVFQLGTGLGDRPLSSDERATIDAFRQDVKLLWPRRSQSRQGLP